ncbi:MAG: hypothetical protein AAF492_29065, partial [Verrucomicrobiota bacterium]
VEIVNISTVAVNLAGVHLANAVDFTFGSGLLAPGQRAVIVRDLQAFASRYNTNGLFIAGVYSGQLNNQGERIEFRDALEQNIATFTYDNGRGWPLAAAGAGHALVPTVDGGLTGALLDYGGNWRAGTYRDGSPGLPDPPPLETVVLNEVVAHTDLSNPSYPDHDSNDAIELFNLTALSVPLTNWYLSDTVFDLRKWAITSNAIAAGGWLAFDEITGFHNPTNIGFGLNKAGEQVLLSYLPGTAEDRVADAIRFKGQENGRSLGRFVDGDPYWATTVPTLGGANALVAPEPFISEVMFHPAPTAEHPEDNARDEYIAVHNPTGTDVMLWNASGPWRIAGEVDLVFPSNTTLMAGETLLLVGFDPAETNAVASFLSVYGLSPGAIGLIGP